MNDPEEKTCNCCGDMLSFAKESISSRWYTLWKSLLVGTVATLGLAAS